VVALAASNDSWGVHYSLLSFRYGCRTVQSLISRISRIYQPVHVPFRLNQFRTSVLLVPPVPFASFSFLCGEEETGSLNTESRLMCTIRYGTFGTRPLRHKSGTSMAGKCSKHRLCNSSSIKFWSVRLDLTITSTTAQHRC
jgi:hypothetical protein